VREILSKIAEVDYYVRWFSSQHDLGIWPSRRVGGTAEFEAIAEYQLGDNPRSINWSATARTGFLRILKNTRLTNTNLAVFLLVDLSPSMDFGTVRVTKRRLAAEISAVLAHAAWRCGDRLGFIGYGSEVEVEWPLRHAKDYRLLVPQKVLETKAKGTGPPGLGPALLRLPAKKALVFLISDFQEDLGEIERALKSIARLHDFVPIVLWDPRERMLPAKRCITVLKDLETGRERMVWLGGTKRNESFQQRSKAREHFLKELFRSLCWEALWIDQETHFIKEISQFFLARRRLIR
jgi:uncharacterized protein (DUF58 family)